MLKQLHAFIVIVCIYLKSQDIFEYLTLF